MEDFRFLQDGSLWIVIIAIFVLLFLCGNGNGCNSFGSDGLGGLFGGCGGNNSWLWIVIIIIIFCCFCKNDCGVFRNELQ
ncbi:MAG: hypothetical protein E7231_11620 [Cellulosilyticum sp.]|nr:hypothetical protein [Cellulosilyticum sp.]